MMLCFGHMTITVAKARHKTKEKIQDDINSGSSKGEFVKSAKYWCAFFLFLLLLVFFLFIFSFFNFNPLRTKGTLYNFTLGNTNNFTHQEDEPCLSMS